MNEIEIIPEQENIVVNVEGVKDYNLLTNKPSINNVELTGNKTLQELGIQPTGDYALKNEIPTKLTQLENDGNFVKDANYVHTDNNFTTGEKEKLASLENYDDTEVRQQVEQNKTDIASNKQEITNIKEDYSLITETGNKISLTINSSTYVMTLQLKDKNGSVLSTGTIDLPLETMVVGASYNADTQEIELTLKNGNKVSFSVSDLVKGLVNEDDLNDTLQDYALKTSIPTKLSQLAEDSTNRLVTDTEKATWNNKVDKVEGKGLSTNDFTNELKSKLDNIEDNAQVNKIEKISLDGVEQEINEKEVNIKSYDINKYFYNALTYNEAKGNDLTFEDSIEFPLGKLDMDGKSEQDLSKMTYKCNGTETGDYYFTYEDTNYQFTMPSVTSSSILVFDTLTLKLSINDEEITTSNSNTGTLIELLKTPNPDYPQEINSIEGDLEYVGYGSDNIFDGILELGGISYITGIEESSNSTIRSKNFINVISKREIYINSEDANTYGTRYYDKNYNYLGRNSFTNYSSFKISIDSLNVDQKTPYYKSTKDIAYMRFVITTSTNTNLKIAFNVKENKYVPYKGRTLTIPTNGQVFRKVGDVADKLIVDMKTGDYYKEKNIGEVVLDGSENYIHNYYNVYTLLKDVNIKEKQIDEMPKILCNQYISYSNVEIKNINYGISQYIPTDLYNYNKIVIKNIDFNNNIALFKEYLASNNVIVDYQLQIPTLEKLGTLTKEQLDTLVTFKGYNNVMINTNLGQADIEIEYVLDMKKYIDEKVAEISAQMI